MPPAPSGPSGKARCKVPSVERATAPQLSPNPSAAIAGLVPEATCKERLKFVPSRPTTHKMPFCAVSAVSYPFLTPTIDGLDPLAICGPKSWVVPDEFANH